MKKKPRIGYMCQTDFDHELGEAPGGIKIYMSKEDCLANCTCATHCGIAKVKITFDKNILRGNMYDEPKSN